MSKKTNTNVPAVIPPEVEKEMEKALEQAQGDRTKEYKELGKNLQQALYYFTNDNPFIGGMIQEMNFKPEWRMPTAALAYDKKRQSFDILLNPKFFNELSMDNRMAILHHEILHFAYTHCFRFGLEGTNQEDKQRINIANDMAINQYIKGLPEGCVDVKFFKDDKGTPFPQFAPSEVYIKLLKDNPKAMENAKKEMQKAGINMKEGPNGDGVVDEHGWENLSEEEKKNMAEEMKKIVKRTMEKTSYDKTSLPGSIKDLIEEIDVFLRKMNYKQILQQAIKKTVSFTDRTSTWKRPNKRYGVVAPGSTMGKLPQLNIYIDTSGSISVKEMNEFLNILNGFLKAGTRKCMLGLWHTALYRKKLYKLNGKLKSSEIEAGGTDMTEVVDDINDTQPDLAIILTDGYYGTKTKIKNDTIVIISENGGMDHPEKNNKKVKTIGMTGLRN